MKLIYRLQNCKLMLILMFMKVKQAMDVKVKQKQTKARRTYVQSEPIDQTCRSQTSWTRISASRRDRESPSDGSQ